MLFTDFSADEYPIVFNFCNSLQMAVIHLSSDLCILDSNDIAARLFNTNKKYLLNKFLTDVCDCHGIISPCTWLKNSKRLSMNTPTTTLHHLKTNQTVEVQWYISRCTSEETNIVSYLLAGKVFITEQELSKNIRFRAIENMYHSLPVAVYCKDLKGVYVKANHYLATTAGYTHPNKLSNFTDYDAPWYSVADDFRAMDQRAIDERSTIIIEEFPLLADGTLAHMLSTKTPLFDENGKVIGMMGTSVNTRLIELNSEQLSFTRREIFLNNNKQDIHLTKREIECAQWLIKGKTAHEISVLLNISKRTVEVHLDNLKRKTGCYKQIQLGYILGKYGSLLLQ